MLIELNRIGEKYLWIRCFGVDPRALRVSAYCSACPCFQQECQSGTESFKTPKKNRKKKNRKKKMNKTQWKCTMNTQRSSSRVCNAMKWLAMRESCKWEKRQEKLIVKMTWTLFNFHLQKLECNLHFIKSNESGKR